jgi:hypothetical protein
VIIYFLAGELAEGDKQWPLARSIRISTELLARFLAVSLKGREQWTELTANQTPVCVRTHAFINTALPSAGLL